MRVPSTGYASPELQPVDQLFSEFIKEHEIPGSSAAISKDSKIIYARGFGFADLENRQLVQPNSLFRIASISKSVTAAAILQLSEQNKLGLDEPILNYLSKYLPTAKPPDPDLSKITILHLLQHQGGFDRTASFDPMFALPEIVMDIENPPEVLKEELICFMFTKPLDFVPGSKHAYSNFGYCLLGKIIEIVSSQSYEHFIQANVLTPVGVTSMRLGRTLMSDRADGEVLYYDETKQKSKAILGPNKGAMIDGQYGAWCLEVMDSHGGWLASAIDLVRFASAFDDPNACKILSSRGIQQMFARPTLEPHADFYGACGWYVRDLGGNRHNTWHTGALPGTSTLLVRRYDGLNWAILFNTRSTKNGEYLASLIDPLMHKAVNSVKRFPSINLPNELQTIAEQ
ncbi:MAG: serine hydrolase [Candidatus Obscuribacterales bacterium]|nr:serine hydrolase [Candidatus Obscuribacterales bacterium]